MWHRWSSWLCILLFVACKFDCDEDQSQVSKQTSNAVTCTAEGCGSQVVDLATSVAAPELKAAIRYNGPEVPLTLSSAAYDLYLKGVSVHAKGAFCAAAGPTGVHASVNGSRAEVLSVFAPVPNLALMARDSEWRPRLRITSITDKSGAELIDFNDPFASDPHFERVGLSEENGLYVSSADYEIRVRAPDVPGSTALLYASRSIALKRTVTIGEVAKITGEVALKLPVGVRVTHQQGPRFSFTDGKTTIAGEITEETKVKLTIGGEDYMRFIQYLALTVTGDAAGETSMRSGTDVNPPRTEIETDHDNPVASMRISLADSVQTLEFPFELKP